MYCPRFFRAELAVIKFGQTFWPKRPRLLQYKFPLKSRVKIKKRALAASSTFDKLSQDPLDYRVWIIKRRGAHVTKDMSLVKTVFLELEEDQKITTQQEEDALVEIL